MNEKLIDGLKVYHIDLTDDDQPIIKGIITKEAINVHTPMEEQQHS
jgi:hypothetical protein